MKKFKNERGAGLIEYTLLVSLVAVASLSAVTAFGEQMSNKIDLNAMQIELAGDSTIAGCGVMLGDGSSRNCPLPIPEGGS